MQVENYLYATSQKAQTTLRSVLGQAHLDELLSERERLAAVLQQVIDEHTDPWGVKVTQVAVKAVDLPHEMQRAMAKQAESEREKRAKIIHASRRAGGRRQLTEAAATLHAQPMALHLRYLQTLTEIAAEKNSTIIFPLPIEFMRAFMRDEPAVSVDTRAARDRRRAHVIRGDIETSSVPELLRSLLGSGETGVLTVRNGDATKTISIHDGPRRLRHQQRRGRAPGRGAARAGQADRAPVPGGQQAHPSRDPAWGRSSWRWTRSAPRS